MPRTMILILLSLCYLTDRAQTNLLENYSFETTNFLYGIDAWRPYNNPNVKLSKEHVYEGSRAAKMSSPEKGITAEIFQIVPVEPYSTIILRHHYYITNWKDGGARMYCYFRERQAEASNLSNDYLKQFYDANILRIIRGGGFGLTYFPHELNKWITFEEEITVPPDAHYFVFDIRSYYGTTLYVDDCFVGVKQETSSIVSEYNTNRHLDYYTINGIRLNNKPNSGAYIIKGKKKSAHVHYRN